VEGGHGVLALGENPGATCQAVRRGQRAGAEGEEGVEEGSGHGWIDSGDHPGMPRGKDTWAQCGMDVLRWSECVGP